MPDLKPCPFCGGKPKQVITVADDNESKIICIKCFVQTSCDYDDLPIEVWNNRAELEEALSSASHNKASAPCPDCGRKWVHEAWLGNG